MRIDDFPLQFSANVFVKIDVDKLVDDQRADIVSVLTAEASLWDKNCKGRKDPNWFSQWALNQVGFIGMILLSWLTLLGSSAIFF